MNQGNFTYLDHNATTLPRAEVVAAMLEALSVVGNPSSIHRAGRAARQQLAHAREAIAAAISVPDAGEIVFTGSGTEANHLALNGIQGRRWLYSAIEHDSVLAARNDGEAIPVSDDGRVDLVALSRLLAEGASSLVSVMAANNETGIIQPIADIVAIAHSHGALVHCDAIQAIGKIPFQMDALGVDLVSMSAHKIGGPQGIGALAFRAGVDVKPLQRGGGQEKGRRAGTENMPGIIGFAAAIGTAVNELDRYAGLADLRDGMEQTLLAGFPEAVVFGGHVPRLPNTSYIALPDIKSETQIMALDLAGIGVSAGSACSSGKVRASHVLTAMGVPVNLAQGAIRISLGRDTVAADIERFSTAWLAMAAGSRQKRAAR